MPHQIWLNVREFSELSGVCRRVATKILSRAFKGKLWRDQPILVRQMPGRGGRSGIRYEVLLSTLPMALQGAFRGDLDAGFTKDIVLSSSSPAARFVPAPRQGAEIERRWAVLRLVAETSPGTQERANAIKDAAHHHDLPVRTIQRWVKRCEDHGWDANALARKQPSNAGARRIWVSRPFDKAFRAVGHSQAELDDMADWVTREIAGWWQSAVQRAGWDRVRLEATQKLRKECANRGYELPRAAFVLAKSRIQQLSYHRAVDIMRNDAKRHDDAKPRIRRANHLLLPMAQVVMDVKPIDCVLMRPDGSLAYPKLIGFMDTGTHRLFGRIVLLDKGEGVRQEHVTDAFLDMVSDPDWGFPQQLYRDNGSEYTHFDLIREALKMIADEGAHTIVNARPYSGASKPIESKFATIDRAIVSQMGGYTGSNRMDKKVQRVGRAAEPYWGTVEAFEEEFFLRLRDFEAMSIKSGPFKGRSPLQIYHDHLDNGWRRVTVNRLALDCAFAKPLGTRRIDRGSISISGERFRHPELNGLSRRLVQVVKPYRRDSWPLANLPDIGWVALEPEQYHLPQDIAGAKDAGRMQTTHRRVMRRLAATANTVDPDENLRDRVAALPTRASPAPLIDVLLSTEAEDFAGARIDAQRKREAQPSAEQRLIARQMEETEELERYLASRRAAK